MKPIDRAETILTKQAMLQAVQAETYLANLFRHFPAKVPSG